MSKTNKLRGYAGIAEDVAVCVLQDVLAETLGSQLARHQKFVAEFDRLVTNGYYESAVRHVETFASSLDEAQSEVLSGACERALQSIREHREYDNVDENRAVRCGRIKEHVSALAEAVREAREALDEEDGEVEDVGESIDPAAFAELVEHEVEVVTRMVENGYSHVMLVDEGDASGRELLFSLDEDSADTIASDLGVESFELVEADTYIEELTEASAAAKLANQIADYLIKATTSMRKSGRGSPVSSGELVSTFRIRPHEADDIIDAIFPRAKGSKVQLALDIMKTLMPAQQVADRAARAATRAQHGKMGAMGQIKLVASDENDGKGRRVDEAKKRSDLDPVFKGKSGALKDSGFTESQARAIADAMGQDFDELFELEESDEDDSADDRDDGDDVNESRTDSLTEVSIDKERAAELVDACRAVGLGSNTDIRISGGKCRVRVSESLAAQMRAHMGRETTTV